MRLIASLGHSLKKTKQLGRDGIDCLAVDVFLTSVELLLQIGGNFVHPPERSDHHSSKGSELGGSFEE